jgi:type I restriction enzyme S subunit
MLESAASFERLRKAGTLDYGDGYRAKNAELGGDGPVFLRAAYLQNSGFILENPDRFKERATDKFFPKVARFGDVVITTKGNSTGRIGLIRKAEEGAVYSPHLSYWRSLDYKVLDQRYLYYWSLSQEFRGQLYGLAYATDMAPYLSLRDQATLNISIPPIVKQRAIGSVLRALDDKIELNRQTNETLEAVARALFKDWFVDFGPTRTKAEGGAPYLAPELWALFPDALDDEDKPVGWAFGSLSTIADSPRREVSPEDVDEETPYIGLEHMPRGCIALGEWSHAEKVTSNKTAFRQGEFLFGKLRPYFHKVGVAPIDGICSTDIVVVVPKKDEWSSFVLACISSTDFVDYTDQTSTGTKMPRTSWKAMGQYEMCLPNGEIAAAFEDILKPAVRQIIESIHESRTLAQTRDLLLPKLMSGDIRLRDAERAVEAVL